MNAMRMIQAGVALGACYVLAAMLAAVVIALMGMATIAITMIGPDASS